MFSRRILQFPHNFLATPFKAFQTMRISYGLDLEISSEAPCKSRKPDDSSTNFFYKIQTKTLENSEDSYAIWLRNSLLNLSHKERRVGTMPFELFVRNSEKSLEKNKINDRVVLIQHAANNPIEDRFSFRDVEDIGGYLVAVFDGHGGSQAGTSS